MSRQTNTKTTEQTVGSIDRVDRYSGENRQSNRLFNRC